jgi:hypothetical protein
MTDPHPEGLCGVAAPDHVSAPRGGGFAFDEGADPYYEGLVTSRFPCLLPVGARGYFILGFSGRSGRIAPDGKWMGGVSWFCRELLGCDLTTAEGMETAKQKGLFTERCPRFVRDAAEILEDVL